MKPKTFGDHLLSFVATFRRLQPKTQLAVVASGALMLIAGSIGIVVGTQSGGDTPSPSAAQTTASPAPPAEPTVTGTTADELLDDGEPSETSKPSERRAKARPRARARTQARARAERRQQAEHRSADGRVFTNCTAAKAAGAAPMQRGTKDYEANSDLDRDGDGVACES